MKRSALSVWPYTYLSCHSFRANEVRLQLPALAYNRANFLRTLALPTAVAHWSLTSLREKLVKIGAKIVTHARYVIFQMAEVAVPSDLFQEILRAIAQLRAPPAPARRRRVGGKDKTRGGGVFTTANKSLNNPESPCCPVLGATAP